MARYNFGGKEIVSGDTLKGRRHFSLSIELRHDISKQASSYVVKLKMLVTYTNNTEDKINVSYGYQGNPEHMDYKDYLCSINPLIKRFKPIPNTPRNYGKYIDIPLKDSKITEYLLNTSTFEIGKELLIDFVKNSKLFTSI